MAPKVKTEKGEVIAAWGSTCNSIGEDVRVKEGVVLQEAKSPLLNSLPGREMSPRATTNSGERESERERFESEHHHPSRLLKVFHPKSGISWK